MPPTDPRAAYRAEVCGRPAWAWLLAVSLAGLVLRVLSALVLDGMHYGALLALFDALGLTGAALLKAIWLHNALLSTLIVPLAFRLGVALTPTLTERTLRVGLFSAAAAALLPTLLYFAPHSQAELHGLLLGTWAYVLWLEGVHRAQRPRVAIALGALLGGVFIARVGLAVFVPLVFADLLLRRRLRELFAASLGFVLAMAALSLADLATWGRPLGSVIEFVKFNWIEGGAAKLEVQPPTYYWDTLFLERFGPATWLLLLPALLGLRRNWRLVLAWLIPFLLLSRVGIKQERFLSTMWPFVLVAAASGWFALGALLSRLPPLRPHALRLGSVIALFALVAVLAFNARGVGTEDLRWRAGHYQALRAVGQDPDSTGVLFDDSLHLSGGHLSLGRHIPLVRFTHDHALEPIFSHVITDRPSVTQELIAAGEFLPILHLEGGVTLLRRRAPLFGAPLAGPAPELRLFAGGTGGEPREVYRCARFVGVEVELGTRGWIQAARALCDDDPDTPWSGLRGDGPVEASRCGPGATVLSLHGRHGAYLDAIGVKCLDSNGRQVHIQAVGGTGGSHFLLACPPPRSLSGLAFETGALVDRVEVRCLMRSEP